ncbi:MAG TPA: hypothetical protein VNK92_05745 [Vicinamibacterales bacterium]|nr:hypothetical protein [Vicinamibacterales bacterium]
MDGAVGPPMTQSPPPNHHITNHQIHLAMWRLGDLVRGLGDWTVRRTADDPIQSPNHHIAQSPDPFGDVALG